MGLLDNLWDSAKGIGKKTLSAVDAVSKADPQVIKLVNERLTEQDKWNDVFSTKLIELLDKGDAVRAEIRKQLAKIVAASRAQEELLRAAEEHRTLNAEYQKTSATLAIAQEKFARAERILTDAEDLKQRVAAYSIAEGQLFEACQAQEQAATILKDANRQLSEVRQTTIGTLRNAESFAVRAEVACKESLCKFEEAQETYGKANTALLGANDVLNEASGKYAEAQQAAKIASTNHTASSSRLDVAETMLRDASKQATEAAFCQTKASEDLKCAEALANTSELLFNQAAAEKLDADTALRKAEQLARRSAAYALVALVAAISICIWGVVRSISLSQYSELAPAALTLLALCYGVYVWRKAQ